MPAFVAKRPVRFECWLLLLLRLPVSGKLRLPLSSTVVVKGAFFCGQCSRPAWAFDECGTRPEVSDRMPGPPLRSSRSSRRHASTFASLSSECSFRARTSLPMRSTRSSTDSEVTPAPVCCDISSCLASRARTSRHSWATQSSTPRTTPSALSIWSSSRFTVRVAPSSPRCSTHLPSFCTPRPCRRIVTYLLVRSTSPRTSEISMLRRWVTRWAWSTAASVW
mmetsp:Transcript_4045/g.10843  ORF Transcript_4045/g.10843 Transcript_4045/m.10843 type:complete len:222 (+) Transcript_4045:580-1245(+)